MMPSHMQPQPMPSLEQIKSQPLPLGRGLHSSTFQLNLSRFGHLLVSPCLID